MVEKTCPDGAAPGQKWLNARGRGLRDGVEFATGPRRGGGYEPL